MALPSIFPFCTKYIEAARTHCCNGLGMFMLAAATMIVIAFKLINQSIVIGYIPGYSAKKSCSQITKY